ncbi:Actin-related protein 6 [Saitoella coloradoensis]
MQLILDNGAYSIKAGFAVESCREIPNCLARPRNAKRVYVADELDSCRDTSALAFRRPFERGYLTSWEVEKPIWDRAFSAECLSVDPSQTSLILTEPLHNLPSIHTACDQIIFEEYEFASYYRTTGASLVPWNSTQDDRRRSAPAEVVLVVDSGFSFTHVVPVIKGEVEWKGVRRINVGGRLITNLLKETISYRHYNMMDETYLINQIKESCCYVSQDFATDLRICHKNNQNDITVSYVLPDFNTNRPGYLVDQSKCRPDSSEPAVTLGNERFTAPELLFKPSDIGLKQAGIAETIMQSIEDMPQELQALLLANVVLVGGSCKIPGFKERLETELRAVAPTEFLLRITKPDDPSTYIWEGGANLADSKEALQAKSVTRAEYLEYGTSIMERKWGRHGKAAKAFDHQYSYESIEEETDDEEQEEDEDMDDAD